MMAVYKELLPRLTKVARDNGYALALHGSGERDLDVIAVPWIWGAVSQEELAKAIRIECGGFLDPAERTQDYFLKGCPGMKPHGRLVWSFHLGGGPYVDLSVMPTRREEREDEQSW